MKAIGTKKILLSLLSGAVMLVAGVGFCPKEYRFLLVLASFLLTVKSLIYWMVLYDQYDPSANVFGVSLSSRRIPVFVEDEGKMNTQAFNTYKWLIVCVVLLFARA